jgi:hypothetical protein
MWNRMTMCGVAVGVAVIAFGQPDDVPREWHPGEIFGETRKAYRAGPVADDVSVEVTIDGGAPRAERLTVRIDAAGVGLEDGPKRVLLELGPLRVYVGGGRLIATHSAEPGAYFEAPFEKQISLVSLQEVLPPLPVPQLALVIPDDAAMRTPTPYTKGVGWDRAEYEGDATPPSVRVYGRGFDGPVELAIDPKTSRIAGFAARFQSDSHDAVLELTCRPVPPGDPAAWEPDVTGRTRVGTLSALRSGARRVELRPGDRVPDFTLIAPDQTAWSLLAAGREASSRPVAVLLFRVPADAARATAIEADARAGLAAVGALRSEGLVADHAGAVIELSEFNREAFLALAEAWARGTVGTTGAGRLLWASSGAASIDRFARDAGALIAVIKPDGTLGGVVRLDGRAGAGTSVVDDLRALIPAG